MGGFFACASTSNRPGRYADLTHRRIAVSGGPRYAEKAHLRGVFCNHPAFDREQDSEKYSSTGRNMGISQLARVARVARKKLVRASILPGPSTPSREELS